MIWFCAADTFRLPRDREPPEVTASGRVTPPCVRRSRTGLCDARSTDSGRSAGVSAHTTPWKEPQMAAKPKPQPTEDAREQARRALQTSLDTRQ
ncbi:hypothetical protein L3i22_095320 [Actinoplanes sp. L3-i22]|nr:hypothetical protein L3i22_095320 [Actinoplanes sp. L3-i22]